MNFDGSSAVQRNARPPPLKRSTDQPGVRPSARGDPASSSISGSLSATCCTRCTRCHSAIPASEKHGTRSPRGDDRADRGRASEGRRGGSSMVVMRRSGRRIMPSGHVVPSLRRRMVESPRGPSCERLALVTIVVIATTDHRLTVRTLEHLGRQPEPSRSDSERRARAQFLGSGDGFAARLPAAPAHFRHSPQRRRHDIDRRHQRRSGGGTGFAGRPLAGLRGGRLPDLRRYVAEHR